MRFFHISDLHIGLQLLDHDLEADQRHILGQIIEHAISERPDAVVIAGDIYNKAAPSPDAVALYDWFLDGLASALPDAAIMIIAGNHDEALRIDMYSGILEKQNIYLAGTPPKKPEDHIRKVVLNDEHGDVVFWLLPFTTPARVHDILADASEGISDDISADEGAEDGSIRTAKPRFTYDDAIRRLIEREDIDASCRNVIVSHQFYVETGVDPDDVEHMDSENLRVGGLGMVRADALRVFDYAALGHLHKPMRVGSDRVRYCGTPMQYSVSEAGQEKGIVVVDMAEKGDVSTHVIPLEPLHRIRKIEGTLDEVLLQASDDYVSITVDGSDDVPASEMRDRIKAAFPNLLAYDRRLEELDTADLMDEGQIDRTSPFDLCLRFLGDATEDQRRMLREVIEEAIGAGHEAD